jgi:hypothetical protein
VIAITPQGTPLISYEISGTTSALGRSKSAGFVRILPSAVGHIPAKCAVGADDFLR